MKKLIALALALMLALSLIACGGDGGTTAPTSGGNTTTAAQSGDTAETQLSAAPSGDADGEFIYAQVGTSMNPTDPMAPVDMIWGFALLFTGENENGPRPVIEQFELYKDGEALGATYYDAFTTNNYDDREYPFANLEDRKAVMHGFYIDEPIESPNPGEYWCEMTINGVDVRTNTFVWHDDGSYEFLDDFVLPQSPISIAPEGDSRIGDIIPFGNYDWRILDVQEGKAFVLSEYILSSMPFNDGTEAVTWEASSLRSYLNGEFYDSFSGEEKSRILAATINCDNPFSNIYGGKETTDKVFLLSAEEVIKYLLWDSGELAEDDYGDPVYSMPPGANITLTALEIGENGEPTRDGESNGTWWLRTSGIGMTAPLIIPYGVDEYRADESFPVLTAGGTSAGGGTSTGGFDFALEQTLSYASDTNGIRPAMWIALDDEAVGGSAPSPSSNPSVPSSASTPLMQTENLEITLQMSNREEPYEGVYNGEVLDGLPHGQGTFDTINAVGNPRTYIGEWNEGHFDGEGRWEHSGHLKFEGTFENDRIVRGKMYNLSGSLYYEGEFREGLRMEDAAALQARIDGYAAEAVSFNDTYWNHIGQIVAVEREVAKVIPDGSSVVLQLHQSDGSISGMNYYPAYGETLPKTGDRILGYYLVYEEERDGLLYVFQDFLAFVVL